MNLIISFTYFCKFFFVVIACRPINDLDRLKEQVLAMIRERDGDL